VRILVDASLVEVYRSGRPSLTLRAYPDLDQRYGVSHDPGVSVTAWSLVIPR
jgi:beta-fructofuranosidase